MVLAGGCIAAFTVVTCKSLVTFSQQRQGDLSHHERPRRASVGRRIGRAAGRPRGRRHRAAAARLGSRRRRRPRRHERPQPPRRRDHRSLRRRPDRDRAVSPAIDWDGDLAVVEVDTAARRHSHMATGQPSIGAAVFGAAATPSGAPRVTVGFVSTWSAHSVVRAVGGSPARRAHGAARVRVVGRRAARRRGPADRPQHQPPRRGLLSGAAGRRRVPGARRGPWPRPGALARPRLGIAVAPVARGSPAPPVGRPAGPRRPPRARRRGRQPRGEGRHPRGRPHRRGRGPARERGRRARTRLLGKSGLPFEVKLVRGTEERTVSVGAAVTHRGRRSPMVAGELGRDARRPRPAGRAAGRGRRAPRRLLAGGQRRRGTADPVGREPSRDAVRAAGPAAAPGSAVVFTPDGVLAHVARTSWRARTGRRPCSWTAGAAVPGRRARSALGPRGRRAPRASLPRRRWATRLG